MMQNNDYEIITKNNSYAVFTDSKKFLTFFIPADLTRAENNEYAIVDGLHGVYDRRKKLFVDNLKVISDLKRVETLGNSLPDYYNVYEDNGILIAESRFYNYEFIDINDSKRAFYKKILSICSFMQEITDKAQLEPVVDVDSIIFEKGNPEAIHFLYIDCISEEKNKLCVQLRNMLIQKVYGRTPSFSDLFKINKCSNFNDYHPSVIRSINKLINILSPVNHKYDDWHNATELLSEICRLIDLDLDYFVNRYIPSKTVSLNINDRVKEGFEKYGHCVFVYSDDMQTLRSVVDNYVVQNMENYVHIVRGNASSGLAEMINGDEFKLHSKINGVSERLRAFNKICSDSTLLIIENCDVENDAMLKKILKLPGDMLFLSGVDYSEYGFYGIKI